MPKTVRWGVLDERNGTLFGPWASKHGARNYAFGRNRSTRGQPFRAVHWPDDGRPPNRTPGYLTRTAGGG